MANESTKQETSQNDYRALIVDDNSSDRELLINALEQVGFSCDEAVDGEEAVQKINDAQYDVVVTDVGMPNGVGYDLACELLEREDRPLMVAVTGVTELPLVEKLLARGVDDILLTTTDGAEFYATKIKFHLDSLRHGPKPPNQRPLKERRWSRRVDNRDVIGMAPFDGAAEIPPNTEFQQVTTKDISSTGIGFHAPEPLEPGQTLILKMGTPELPKFWKAEVVHCSQQKYLVGCRFTGVLHS